jgi:prepilin-type processing-associated H-X9-DG protein
VTNGGAAELVATGNVAACFSVMSYELSTPKILICPADTSHVWVTNFDGNFNNSHISYFVSPDVANETNASMILIGDDNLAINGVALNSGIVELSTQFSWTKKRHDHAGNIGYGDGSVAEISDDGLDEAASLATKSGTNVLINRIAIP